MGIDRVRVDGQRRAPVSPNVDLPLTAVQGELLSVAAWYDNEMGYSARLAEAVTLLAKWQAYCMADPGEAGSEGSPAAGTALDPGASLLFDNGLQSCSTCSTQSATQLLPLRLNGTRSSRTWSVRMSMAPLRIPAAAAGPGIQVLPPGCTESV